MPRTLARSILAALALVAFTVSGPSGRDASTARADDDELHALAIRAVDADAPTAEAALTALRSRGASGLAALARVHAADLATLRDAPTLPPSPETERLRHAVDRVSGQRDGHASGLYFHSDLPAALAEARRRHVSVLSLRMLGHLDQELSCANSRYFRTLVYSDPAVAQMLRERFVLHVSMEREAPTITIDMGDGRTMVRTITGNSVHYVIDAEGRVVDALPGLYSPTEFTRALEASLTMNTACAARHGAEYDQCLGRVHQEALVALRARWETLRSSFGDQLPTWDALNARAAPPVAGRGAPSARAAMAETMSKMMVEAPLLDTFARTPTPQPYEGINWPRLVNVYAISVAPTTLALLRLKSGTADVATLAQELGRNASADSLRNELTMHRRVHAWYIERPTHAFEDMNTRVYTELFLTPASDPWLGLRANDVWDAIETVH